MNLYRVGDRVRIVNYRTPKMNSMGEMDEYFDEIMTIEEVREGEELPYKMEEDGGFWYWSDEMIKEKVGEKEGMYRGDNTEYTFGEVAQRIMREPDSVYVDSEIGVGVEKGKIVARDLETLELLNIDEQYMEDRLFWIKEKRVTFAEVLKANGRLRWDWRSSPNIEVETKLERVYYDKFIDLDDFLSGIVDTYFNEEIRYILDEGVFYIK